MSLASSVPPAEFPGNNSDHEYQNIQLMNIRALGMWVTSVYNGSCCRCSAVSIADDTSSGEVSGPVVTVGLEGFTGSYSLM